MKCPYCAFSDSRVIDSRDVMDGVRRRRQCLRCQRRFTTYERIQRASLYVIKKDGRHEEYDHDKMAAGLRKACEKLPLPENAVEKLAEEIETRLYQMGSAEISSREMGDIVMKELKKLNHVAYIRFASVYREFTDVDDYQQALSTLSES